MNISGIVARVRLLLRPLFAVSASALVVTALAVPSVAGRAAPAAAAADRSVPAAAATRAEPRAITRVGWDTSTFAQGTGQGVAVTAEGLALSAPTGRRTVAGRSFAVGNWTGPWIEPGPAFTELIASWSARTPGRSFIEVRVRGRAANGTMSSWDSLARWATGEKQIERTSFGAQSDDLASLATDTWRSNDSAGLTGLQLRVILLAPADRPRVTPRVTELGAMVSRLPQAPPPVSAPGPGAGTVLQVPGYSQMLHRGHYPQWGGGGQAWCSPTSTAMVLGYYGALPPPRAYAWVPAGHPDPWVDEVARRTYDYGYRGTGNWTFNTAYAATRTGRAFVTRLPDLTAVEPYLRAGIPVIASIAFARGALTGAPISASSGHLVVIVGITATGAVVVNDPAAPTNATVTRTYDRAQFEAAWLGGSGGVGYIITDAAHPLPQ